MATTIAALLQRNKAGEHPSLPYLSELKASGTPPIRTLIVTCCDPRCIPENYFNLKPGEVIVHRNAGGNVRHAVRDILALDIIFTLEEIAIIHHTDCGTLYMNEDSMHDALKARVDKSLWSEADAIKFGANKDIVESVKGDLEWVRDNKLIRDQLKKGIQGFVFDIKTGNLDKVDLA